VRWPWESIWNWETDIKDPIKVFWGDKNDRIQI